MALAPIGMANVDVGLFEANNPLISVKINGGDTVIPDTAIEYVLLPASPAGGEPTPSWWIELNSGIKSGSVNPFTAICVILAPSTGAVDGTTVPRPVFNPETMVSFTGFVTPSFGGGDVYYAKMGSATMIPVPQTSYSAFVFLQRDEGDTADYTLKSLTGFRKNIS